MMQGEPGNTACDSLEKMGAIWGSAVLSGGLLHLDMGLDQMNVSLFLMFEVTEVNKSRQMQETN